MLGGGDCVFTVSKTPKSITLEIHSPDLRAVVLLALSGCPDQISNGSGDLNAFVLLKHCIVLERKLQLLQQNSSRRFGRKQDGQLVAELDLLVNGLLKDREVFHSFGYENLYRQGYLTYDRWQSFQQTKIDRDLNALENSFYAVDEARRSHTKNRFIQALGFSFPTQAASAAASSSSSSTPDDNLLRTWASLPSPDAVSTGLSMAASQGHITRVEELLNHGADPNSVQLPFYLRPALIEAIRGGHEDVARLLLSRGANKDGVTVDGFATLTHRPLLAAFRRGNGAMFQALVRAGADPGSFVEAPSEEQWLIAKTLLEDGVDADLLLQKAYDAGNPDKRLVSVLLDGGATLNNVMKKPSTLYQDDALHDSQKLADDLASFRSLNAQLINASVGEDLESMRGLLKSGAEPSFALPAALQNGCFESLRLLLDAGANPKYMSCFNQVCPSLKAETADILLQNAIAVGHTPLTRFLLDHGASHDRVCTSTGLVPLVAAIRGGRRAITELLLERGAAVNQNPTGNGGEPLAEALATRDSGLLGMLLRHGARYEGTAETETAVQETFQSHSDLRQDLWDFACPLYQSSDSHQPSDSTLPDQEAIKTHVPGDMEERQAKIDGLRRTRRKELESMLGSPEAALIVAAAQGNILEVQAILGTTLDPTIRKGVAAASLINLDAVFREPLDMTVDDGSSVPRELTALMAASLQGDQRLVKLLLQHGADVNVLTKSGTALSIAAEVGSDTIMRLLLQRQADLHVAVFVLRSTDPDSGAIRRLNAAASRLRQDLVRSGIQTRINFRRLYFEFLREHALMKTVGQTMTEREAAWARKHYRSLEYLDLSCPAESVSLTGEGGYRYRWAMGLERHGRRAWAVSISVLRGLCRGVLPATLCETLTFLSLARAISTTMDAYGFSDRQSKFTQDLSRWQLLFTPEDGSLEAFKEAVHAIWGVMIQDDASRQCPDKDSLLQFQVLASSLVRRVDDCLYLAELVDGGLLGSQRQWFLRRSSRSNQHSALARQHHISRDGAVQEAESTFAEPRVRFTRLGHGGVEDGSYGPSLRQSMHKECYFEDFQPLVVFLMAGAIFATLLLFLAEIRQTLDKTHGASPLEQTLRLERQQRPVLKSALYHILLTCNPTPSLEALGKVKMQTIRAIGDGLLTSFGQLTRFFAEQSVFNETDIDQAETRYVRQQLVSSCAIWSSTYDVQETYRALEIYLGLNGYVPLVPPVLRPRGYGDVFEEAQSPPTRPRLDLHAPSYQPLSALTDTRSHQEVGDDYMASSSTSAARSEQPSPLSEVLPRRPRKTFCDECGRDFKKVFNYNKHRKDKHDGCRYSCRSPRCPKSFSRHAYREIHERKKHQLHVR